jgi:hypothetical protein
MTVLLLLLLLKLLENREFFELLLVSVYKALAGHFQGKSSVLKTIDFGKAHEFDGDIVKSVKTEINEKVQQSAAMKKYSRDEIVKYVDLLDSLPLEYLEDGVKSFAFGLNLALFVDCAATREEELTMKAYKVFLSKYFFLSNQENRTFYFFYKSESFVVYLLKGLDTFPRGPFPRKHSSP